MLEPRCLLATFTVTNTADDLVGGATPGSLRQAIASANFNPGPDTIDFEIRDPITGTIQAGPQTIQLVEPLPEITDPVTIDGYTQPSSNPFPPIVLDGSLFNSGGAGDGLVVDAGDTTIRGLAIGNFPGSGVVLKGWGNDVVADNFIGTTQDGTQAAPNGQAGIRVLSPNNVIGSGPAGTGGNLISGNLGNGLELGGYDEFDNFFTAEGTVVHGNRIGTDRDGVASLSNGNALIPDGAGVWVLSPRVEIGGTTPTDRNVISGGSFGAGIRVFGEEVDIRGNYIGTTVDGDAPLGNLWGVISYGDRVSIGGTSPDDRNVISGNRTGIWLFGSDDTVTGNYIGTDPSGLAAVPNSDGVDIEGPGAVVGGSTAGVGNLISGNDYGIWLGLYNPDNVVDPGGSSVEGNVLGIDSTGTAALSNLFGDIVVYSPNNTIGGTAAGAGNVLAGSQNPVGLFQGDGNLIIGNRIGTDPAGQSGLPPGPGINTIGVEVETSNNTIGGSAIGAGNLISGLVFGVIVDGTNNQIEGNWIGTTAGGDAPLGNAWGLYVDGSDNTVGGATPGTGNLISGNGIGIDLIGAGATRNVIRGNRIGTDFGGTFAVGNLGDGLLVQDAPRNTIGGTADGFGNLISGNNNGIRIIRAGSVGNVVAGNRIGTDASGLRPVGNRNQGVLISNASGNQIGGLTEAERNLISGNNVGVGLSGSGTTGNIVVGNWIGTDATGLAGIGNSIDGVDIGFGASHNRIGGALSGEGNVVAASGSIGISITLPTSIGNLVQGNLIGTDRTGAAPLGNGSVGLYISASETTIGGTGAKAGNVIAASHFAGINITESPEAIVIQGNWIGTNADGGTGLGNAGDGVLITGAGGTPSSVTVGGTSAGAGNVIADNGGAGVRITGGSGHSVLGNAIRDNGGLGIDLGTVGPTPNDPGDADDGPNGLQNAPALTGYRAGPSNTTIQGALSSTPGTTFRVEFFASPAADPSGFGEGAALLGAISVMTDGSGAAAFTATLPALAPAGSVITATATDPQGSTSEFSNAVTASVPVTVLAVGPVSPDPRRQAVSDIDVRFSGPVAPDSFDPSDLTLTHGTVTISLVGLASMEMLAPDLYRISGVAGPTSTDGTYLLTVSGAGVLDSHGFPVEGSASDSWTMDTVPPTSRVNALSDRQTSLNFTVSVAAADSAGVVGSGIASIDIQVAVDGGPFSLWTTLPAGVTAAVFPAQSSHTYAFRSVAQDGAGNIESKTVVAEASTYVPDLDPPVTRAFDVEVTGFALLTVSFFGRDYGGGDGRFRFEVWRSIDFGVPTQIGVVDASLAPDGSAIGSLNDAALVDGLNHTYSYFTIGVDSNGNRETPPPGFPPIETLVTALFGVPQVLTVSNFAVNFGAAQRSFVRYLSTTLSSSNGVSTLVASVNDGNSFNDRIRLFRYDLNGTPMGELPIVGQVSASDRTISIDFGPTGIGGRLGGNGTSILGDGYYQLALDLDGNGSLETQLGFYRLLGDVNGDRVVDSYDLNLISHYYGSFVGLFGPDVDGNGLVNSTDYQVALRSLNRRLSSSLILNG